MNDKDEQPKTSKPQPIAQPKILTTDNLNAEKPKVKTPDAPVNPPAQNLEAAEPDVIRYDPTSGTGTNTTDFAPIHTVHPTPASQEFSDYSEAIPTPAPHIPVHPANQYFEGTNVQVDLSGVMDFAPVEVAAPRIKPMTDEDRRIAEKEASMPRNPDGTFRFSSLDAKEILADTQRALRQEIEAGDVMRVTPFDRTRRFVGAYFAGSINGHKFRALWGKPTIVPRSVYELMVVCGAVLPETPEDEYRLAPKEGKFASVQYGDTPYRIQSMGQYRQNAMGMG